MRRGIVYLGLTLMSTAAAGCACIGAGLASTDANANAVEFKFKNQDDVSGIMNSAAPDNQPTGEEFF